MESVIQSFVTTFNMLSDIHLFNIPVLVWFLLPAVVTIILKFINGKK